MADVDSPPPSEVVGKGKEEADMSPAPATVHSIAAHPDAARSIDTGRSQSQRTLEDSIEEARRRRQSRMVSLPPEASLLAHPGGEGVGPAGPAQPSGPAIDETQIRKLNSAARRQKAISMYEVKDALRTDALPEALDPEEARITDTHTSYGPRMVAAIVFCLGIGMTILGAVFVTLEVIDNASSWVILAIGLAMIVFAFALVVFSFNCFRAKIVVDTYDNLDVDDEDNQWTKT